MEASHSICTQNDIDEELFLRQITELVINQRLLAGRALPEDLVVNFHHPHELKELVDLSIGDTVCNQSQLLELCQQAVDYSVRTNHPKFLNQLYHSVDPVGLAGTWLTEALNTNSHTFEAAPFFILVEHAVLAHMRSFIGWKEGDGIFSPGGSLSNMYGMVLARYIKFPEVKAKGVANIGQLVAFTSQESHYSIIKAAHWIGLGTENVIEILSDDTGRMIPSELESQIKISIEQGKIPFFVNATAGTTVLGAYDPLEPLADICLKYKLWLHLDACWGGAALISHKHRHLMKGIDRVDSVAWNPHKMLGAPLQCAAFLIKRSDILHRCNGASASYLFQPDKFYDVSYDTGDKSVQCGRKVDAFKLWLLWKARGDRGLEKLVDNSFDCAAYIARQISTLADFRLVIPDISCTNVCFWYIPPRLQHQEETPEWWNQVSLVAPVVKKRMIEKGSLMIGYQPLAHKKWVNFFRLVIPSQPPPSHEDMDFILEEIVRLGSDL